MSNYYMSIFLLGFFIFCFRFYNEIIFTIDGVGNQRAVRPTCRIGPALPDAALVPAATIPNAGAPVLVAGRR